jgi:hypothetical protein
MIWYLIKYFRINYCGICLINITAAFRRLLTAMGGHHLILILAYNCVSCVDKHFLFQNMEISSWKMIFCIKKYQSHQPK